MHLNGADATPASAMPAAPASTQLPSASPALVAPPVVVATPPSKQKAAAVPSPSPAKPKKRSSSVGGAQSALRLVVPVAAGNDRIINVAKLEEKERDKRRKTAKSAVPPRSSSSTSSSAAPSASGTRSDSVSLGAESLDFDAHSSSTTGPTSVVAAALKLPHAPSSDADGTKATAGTTTTHPTASPALLSKHSRKKDMGGLLGRIQRLYNQQRVDLRGYDLDDPFINDDDVVVFESSDEDEEDDDEDEDDNDVGVLSLSDDEAGAAAPSGDKRQRSSTKKGRATSRASATDEQFPFGRFFCVRGSLDAFMHSFEQQQQAQQEQQEQQLSGRRKTARRQPASASVSSASSMSTAKHSNTGTVDDQTRRPSKRTLEATGTDTSTTHSSKRTRL